MTLGWWDLILSLPLAVFGVYSCVAARVLNRNRNGGGYTAWVVETLAIIGAWFCWDFVATLHMLSKQIELPPVPYMAWVLFRYLIAWRVGRMAHMILGGKPL